MKIAVVGAETELGRRIVVNAERERIGVTCVLPVWQEVGGDGPLIIKDYSELTRDDFAGQFAVVDVITFPLIDSRPLEELPLWKLLDVLSGTGVRLFVIGSAALLYTDSERRERVCEAPGLYLDDNERRPRLSLLALRHLSSRRDCRWSMLCPPLNLLQKGVDSGRYEFSEAVLPMSLEGSSRITLSGFSRALVEFLKRQGPDFTLNGVRAI